MDDHIIGTLRHFTRLLVHIVERIEDLEQRMNTMSENQTRIDTDVAALQSGLAGIVAEIDALKAQPGAAALDFTALDAVTANITAVSAPTPPTA